MDSREQQRPAFPPTGPGRGPSFRGRDPRGPFITAATAPSAGGSILHPLSPQSSHGRVPSPERSLLGGLPLEPINWHTAAPVPADYRVRGAASGLKPLFPQAGSLAGLFFLSPSKISCVSSKALRCPGS